MVFRVVRVGMLVAFAVACSNGESTSAAGTNSGSPGSGQVSKPPQQVSKPPQVVGACSALPATGKWERIGPADAPLPAMDFEDGVTGAIGADPVHSGTVYVGVKGHGLYQSTDCGASWTLLNTGRNGDKVVNGTPISIVVDPVDTNVIYMNSLYGSSGVWKSIDGGHAWDQMIDDATTMKFAGGFVSYIVMDPDPARHGHVLASPHAECSGTPWKGCMAETFDGGKTWKLIQAPPGFEGVGPIFVDEKTFLFTGGMYLTEDGGDSWTEVGGSNAVGGGFAIHRTAGGTYVLPSLSGVLTSSDLRNWTGTTFGRLSPLVAGDAKLFAGDQWSPTYWTASDSAPMDWSKLPSPGELGDTSLGAAFLAYDEGHHILYSSNFRGGLFRLVTQ
jgi:photosystem II stability/assembly factor-like uncharacterized protein